MNRPAGLLLAAGIALSVPSCTGIPPTHYYLLEWQSSSRAPAVRAASPGVRIGVESFSIEPPYDQDRIVYRADPDTAEAGFYAYHRWAAPLSRMLPRMVADGLAGIDGVASIEPAVSGKRYDLLLGGRLLRLLEVDTDAGHEARVRIAFSLRRPGTGVLWEETLDAVGRTGDPDVESVVREMNEAVAVLIGRARARITARIDADRSDPGLP